MKFKHIHQKNIYVVSLILRGHISLFFPYNTVTIFVRGKEKINSGKKVLLSYMKENAFLSEKLFRKYYDFQIYQENYLTGIKYIKQRSHHYKTMVDKSNIYMNWG